MKAKKTGGGIEAIFKGFSDIVEKLGELADKAEGVAKSGEFSVKAGGDKDLKGIYGFSVKVGGLGQDKQVKVEPFGNIRKDKESGRSVVHEVREPMVDVFEEEDHALVVAEMPGIGVEDVKLEIRDDLLTLTAEKGRKKYRKEVLLPGTYPRDKMSVVSNNGIIEIRCAK